MDGLEQMFKIDDVYQKKYAVHICRQQTKTLSNVAMFHDAINYEYIKATNPRCCYITDSVHSMFTVHYLQRSLLSCHGLNSKYICRRRRGSFHKLHSNNT